MNDLKVGDIYYKGNLVTERLLDYSLKIDEYEVLQVESYGVVLTHRKWIRPTLYSFAELNRSFSKSKIEVVEKLIEENKAMMKPYQEKIKFLETKKQEVQND